MYELDRRVWIGAASDFGRKAWKRYQRANMLLHWSKFKPMRNILRKKAYELYDEADEYFDLAYKSFEKAEL